MTILITGVSGFVGQQLAVALIEKGYSVIGADIQHRPSELDKSKNYSFILVDLCDEASIARLPLDRTDAIFHLAAAGVKTATRLWPLCLQVNVRGTAILLKQLLSNLANGKKAPIFIYTKSFYEDHLDTISSFRSNPYVATKAAATKWIESIASVYGHPVRIAKVYQVYGPSDDANNVLSYAAQRLKSGKQATFSSGLSARDWIYIDDFINGLIACLQINQDGLTHFDIGTGTLTSIKDMVLQIGKLCHVSEELMVFDSALDRGDLEIYDVAEKLPDLWQPQYDVVRGLQSLLEGV